MSSIHSDASHSDTNHSDTKFSVASPSSKKGVYLDHNATTPVALDVVKNLPLWACEWGNPSSIHWSGRGPKALLRKAHADMAKMLGCHPLEIVFTSGGSEANNMAIKGIYFRYSQQPVERRRNKYILSAVEHPSLVRCMEFLKSQGLEVHHIPVSRQGVIDIKAYESLLDEQTALVSIMYVNNETGTIFPIKKMAEMAHKVGAFFHTDGVQALGKIPVNVGELGVDFASFSAHKFYALKGTGLLYCKNQVGFESLIHGGGQERHRRAGTENTLGIAAFAQMAPWLEETHKYGQRVAQLRDQMEARIVEEIPRVSVTGHLSDRVPHCSHIVIDGIDGETLLMSLDLRGYCVSTGAACSAGSVQINPALLAMGLNHQEAQGSLRVSLGWENTQEEISGFVETLKEEVERLRHLSEEEETDQ